MIFKGYQKHFTSNLAKKDEQMNFEYIYANKQKSYKLCITYPRVDGTLKDLRGPFGSPYYVSGHTKSLHTGHTAGCTHP